MQLDANGIAELAARTLEDVRGGSDRHETYRERKDSQLGAERAQIGPGVGTGADDDLLDVGASNKIDHARNDVLPLIWIRAGVRQQEMSLNTETGVSERLGQAGIVLARLVRD